MNKQEFELRLKLKLEKDSHNEKIAAIREEKALKDANNRLASKIKDIVDYISMAQSCELHNISLDSGLVVKYKTGCFVEGKFGLICKELPFYPVRQFTGMGIFLKPHRYDSKKCFMVDVNGNIAAYISSGSYKAYPFCPTSREVNDFIDAFNEWEQKFERFSKMVGI